MKRSANRGGPGILTKIGALALENDLFEHALSKAGWLSAKR